MTLIERSPYRGYRPPREENPLRVALTQKEYDSLLAISKDLDWRFHVALVLAHETGHRIGSIRTLRWSDVDLEGGQIRWRAENDKIGHEHVTPLTEAAVGALRYAREASPGIGDAPVLPSPEDASKPMSRHLARDRWKQAEKLAGLKPKRGRGWHSLRRKFASELMHQPLKVLCEMGGWKSMQTVFECYQQADQEQMREALKYRRRA